MFLTRRVFGLLKVITRDFSSVSVTGTPTALYEFHVKHGGKMVNFGGFILPVQYSDQSITSSHHHTRNHASLFDVSHMLQTEIHGPGCISYMERICTADIEGLENNVGALTVFTDDNAGILDDLIVTRISQNDLYIVSNAARRYQDQRHMLQALATYRSSSDWRNVNIRFFETTERSLLALQGPESAECLQPLVNVDLKSLYFMRSTIATVAGVESCRITRCGYTGEDGFEICIPAIKSADIAETLVSNSNVKLAGLGARDSLRLEAGLCLYGNDIDTETTPVEAGLLWLVAKRRRNLNNYPGAYILQSQIKSGVQKKRVGLMSLQGPPARQGTQIFIDSDRENSIGTVTSGCPSPTLNKNIAMGYVPLQFSKPGTELFHKIRDKYYKTVVTKMPFVSTHYYIKGK